MKNYLEFYNGFDLDTRLVVVHILSCLISFAFLFLGGGGGAGKGSYGAVYKARDLKTSELVAVKVISLTEGVCFFSHFLLETSPIIFYMHSTKP